MSEIPGQPKLSERLAKVRVDVREDLEVSRHVFRGEAFYILRDPITFNSHRFSVADYNLLCRINADVSLAEVFEAAVKDKLTERDQAERFYQFVFSLHQFGFLRLPISDDKLLYRRYRAKQAAKFRQKALGFLFLQVPLWNPNAFLERTERYFRPLFTPVALAIWIIWCLAALGVAFINRAELTDTAQGLLATSNLAVMWPTLIVLKVFHEFGHAYACRRFGGHVPEMGAFLIVFTPCAYVDATASWGFPRKRDRIIVALAGMYIELAIAAGATFIWAATGPGLINAIAYNIVFLASVVTLLFNINPLMRYDGYYVFSDLVETPNLRARATAYATATLKRYTLGIRDAALRVDRRLAALLLSFGIASSLYRVMIMSGIAALLAVKFGMAGLGMACVFLGMFVFSLARKMIRYLWFADETRSRRAWAVALSLIPLIAAPTLFGLVPAPRSVQAAAVISAEREATLHVETPGVLYSLAAQAGAYVEVDQPVALLRDDDVVERQWQAETDLVTTRLRAGAAVAEAPAAAQEWDRRVSAREAEWRRATQRTDGLTLTAPFSGYLASTIAPTEVGRRFEIGEPVARLVTGERRVRALLSAEQIATAQPRAGSPCVFRPACDPGRTIDALVERVRPLGAREISHAALTLPGGGDIPIAAESGQAAQPYFEVEIRLLAAPESRTPGSVPGGDDLPLGMTGRVRFTADSEPLGHAAWRSLLRFTNHLREY